MAQNPYSRCGIVQQLYSRCRMAQQLYSRCRMAQHLYSRCWMAQHLYSGCRMAQSDSVRIFFFGVGVGGGGGGGSKHMPLTLCLTSFIISLAEMKSMTECKLMVLLPWTEKTIQTQRCLKGVGERYRRSCRQSPSWWCRIAYRAHRESQVGCFIGLVSLTSCATC